MAKSWFSVKEIHPNTWAFAEFDHFEKVISYLFVGKNECLLFDSGMGIGDLKKEIRKITKLNILLVNSHSHYDHTGGNSQFKNNQILNFDQIKHMNKIYIDPFKFEVLLTPGHTSDSICLLEHLTGYLLSGDTLYPGPIYLYLPNSNVNKYVKSFKKLVKKEKYIKKILPGHNKPMLKQSVLKEVFEKIKNLENVKEKTVLTYIDNISFILRK